MNNGKIAVVSDIHANLDALYNFIEYVDKEKIEVVINLGDYISGGPYPCEVFDLVMKDKRFINIRGYAEESLFSSVRLDQGIGEGRWLKKILGKERIELLKGISSTKEIELYGEKMMLCHHNGWADIEQIVAHTNGHKNDHYNYILCGGTHLQEFSHSRRFYTNTNIIDPGTLGDSKNTNGYFATINFRQNQQPEVRFHNIKIQESQKIVSSNRYIAKAVEKKNEHKEKDNQIVEREELKEVYLYIQGHKQGSNGMMYIEDKVIDRIIQIGIRQCKYITIGCWSHEKALIREVLYYLKCRKIKKSEKEDQEWYSGEITDEVIELLAKRKNVFGDGLKWFEISFQNHIEDTSPMYSIFNYGKKGYLKRLTEKDLYSMEEMLKKYDLIYTFPDSANK